MSLSLLPLPGLLAICKLPPGAPVPAWAAGGPFVSVTRTSEELSIVCPQEAVPEGVVCEKSWRALRVAGSMPFELVGVLQSLVAPLAAAKVAVFVVSTFDTDYLLVKAVDFDRAVACLRAAGHSVAAPA